MNKLSPELSLLLAATRMEPADDAAAILKDTADMFDWTYLVNIAYAHGVTGLLCRSILQQPKALIPDEICHAAQEHLKQRLIDNQTITDQLSNILANLASAGIEAIPFKGPILAVSAYGDLALRSFCDLDIFIRKEQIESCMDRLKVLGYEHAWNLSPRQWQEYVDYSGQDILFGEGAPVEPHWAFAPRTMVLNFDYAALWQRTVSTKFNGQDVDVFSPEDELIILCVHGCKEKWLMLKWVADIAEFIRSHVDLDWQCLFERAQSQGFARIVALSLALSKQLLDAPLPAVAQNWISQDKTALSMSKNVSECYFDPRESGKSIYQFSKFHFKMRERWQDRWLYVWRTLTQARTCHYMDIALPDRLFFLYTPYKVLHDYLLLPIWLIIKRIPGQCVSHQPISEH